MPRYTTRFGRAGACARATGLLALALAAGTRRAEGQTDYYNTDAGRPMQVEDASPVERGALELQVAPLRLERARGARYRWGVEPEVAWGVAPRTQVEVGLPLAWLDGGTHGTAGLGGVDVVALHQLNLETRRLPALAVGGALLLPAGSLAARGTTYASAKGIATRTFAWGRLHANAQAARALGGGRRFTTTTGVRVDEPAPLPTGAHLARWAGGLSVDHTWPFRAMLGALELVAQRPFDAHVDGNAATRRPPVEWMTAAGTRFQLDPRWAADAGVGYRLTGDDRGWSVTLGAAVTLGVAR